MNWFILDGTFALEIANCTADDEDVYELLVENMASVDSCLFKISVETSGIRRSFMSLQRSSELLLHFSIRRGAGKAAQTKAHPEAYQPSKE